MFPWKAIHQVSILKSCVGRLFTFKDQYDKIIQAWPNIMSFFWHPHNDEIPSQICHASPQYRSCESKNVIQYYYTIGHDIVTFNGGKNSSWCSLMAN